MAALRCKATSLADGHSWTPTPTIYCGILWTSIAASVGAVRSSFLNAIHR
jgi:hypothetical protein